MERRGRQEINESESESESDMEDERRIKKK